MNKSEVERLVVEEMTAWWESLADSVRGPLGHYCLWWAATTVKILNGFGLKAQLNAGSAKWKVCEDDGVNPDHFGYEFAWNAESKLQYLTGHMPEMHVWAAVHPKDCPERRGQVVDMTVRFQARRSLEHGVIPDRTLPDYVWFYPDAIPDGVYYSPSPDATRLAYRMLES